MQLVIGSTYESSRGFGRLLYLGETHGIDGYLPTFRTTKGEFKHYSYDQLQSALFEFAAPTVSRADELIACLEGEIAKRDARIVELELTVFQLNNSVTSHHWENTALRAELAAIKAQEPVAWMYRHSIREHWHFGATRQNWWECLPLYAAPVSEAKAQGVVMPEPDFYWVEADEGSWNSPEEWAQDYYDYNGEKPGSVSFSCAIELPSREYDSFEFDANGSCVSCRLVNPEVARLNAAPVQQPKCKTCDDNGRIGGQSFYAPDEGGDPCPDCCAPVQQVSVPDGWKLVPVEPTPGMIDAALRSEDASLDPRSIVIADYRAMLAAAPAAPAADAGLVEALEKLARLGNGDKYGTSDGNLIAQAALAAHRSKGVV